MYRKYRGYRCSSPGGTTVPSRSSIFVLRLPVRHRMTCSSIQSPVLSGTGSASSLIFETIAEINARFLATGRGLYAEALDNIVPRADDVLTLKDTDSVANEKPGCNVSAEIDCAHSLFIIEVTTRD